MVTTSGTNGITTTTGTSFACPLTAGVVGLAYSIPCTNFMDIVRADPRLGADLVRQATMDGVDVKSQLASKFITGGRLNAKNTLDNLMTVGCSDCYGSEISVTVTGNAAVVNFNPNSEVSSVQLNWRKVGDSSWQIVNSITAPYHLASLDSCSKYELFLKSLCGSDTTASSIYSFDVAGCGTCIDLTYCSSMSTESNPDEWIETFTIGGQVFNSGFNNGYLAPSAASEIELRRNGTYTISIEPGFSGTMYTEYSRLWIDLDQSGTFETSEMLFDQGTASTSTANGTIHIPMTAALGSTRLRVQMAYRGVGQNTAPDVCAAFQWGEVEDYCVTILPHDLSVESTDMLRLNVYPNPAKNSVIFAMGEDLQFANIEIIDIVGKVMYANEINQSVHSVDISNFKSGTYIYRVLGLTRNVISTGKLVVEK